MKIPQKLKIGGHTYKVIYDKDNSLGEVACAKISREKGTIALNTVLMRTELEASLFHEIFHAINNQLNEVTSESLSQQIYQVLKENKLLK